MNFTDDELISVKKFEGYKQKAIQSYKMTLTKFLNLREQEMLKFVIGHNEDVCLYFSNVSEYDEYKRAIISPFELEPDFNIEVVHVEYNKKFISLDHRHVLGTIMCLQIERNMLGDILVSKDKDIYFVIAKELANFVIDNIYQINNAEVKLSIVNKPIGDFRPEYKINKYFVNSLRLDLVTSQGFNISRNVCQDLIKEGNLKLNSKVEQNLCKNIELNDVISLKGYGRIKILNIGGLSKRDKICIEIGKLK